MRALLLVSLASSGCLISEPEGKPTYWPPQLGGTLEALVAADLDANGSTDIVAFMSGDESAAGAYYLSGSKDLAWGTSDIVTSFSRFVPLDIVHPVAALVVGDVAPAIYVATGSDTLQVTKYSNTLTVVDTATTAVPGGGTAWLAPLLFPGDQEHIAVSNGSTVQHFPTTDFTDVKLLPPNMDMGMTWTGAQTATGYKKGSDFIAVMATADTTYRCVIPMAPPFQWSTVREGPPYLGQIAYDLDNDGSDEIIGFDAQQHDVCIVTVETADVQCIHLDSTATGTEVQIFAGVNITAMPGPDILVTQATSNGTAYSIIEDISKSNGTYSYLSIITPGNGGPGHGKSVFATPANGMPPSLLTFGTNGAARCVLGPPELCVP